jgi:cytochrome oxidase Cu insertion factor (SCO1/SenC/PrrC family)
MLRTVAIICAALAGLTSSRAADLLTLAPERPLTFVDGHGAVVRSTDFTGKWLLVYFGYTHCSEVCPTGLSVLAAALEQIGAAAEHVQPLFITVDPERDSGPLLLSFTRSFDPRLIGLSGSLAEIRQAADSFGVSFRKVALAGSDYTVDHSATYTLVDPTHRHARVLRLSEPHALAAALLAELRGAGVALDRVINSEAYR